MALIGLVKDLLRISYGSPRTREGIVLSKVVPTEIFT